MKKVLTFAALVLLLAMMAPGVPVGAATLNVPDQTFGFRIVEQEYSGDSVEFFGLDESKFLDQNDVSALDNFLSTTDGLGLYAGSQNLIDNVLSSLGVNPSEVTYKNQIGTVGQGTQVTAKTRVNIFQKMGNRYELSVATSVVAAAVSKNDKSQFVVGVCPYQIAGSYASQLRKPDGKTKSCDYWIEQTASATDLITYKQTPKSGPFWGFIKVLAGLTVLTTVLFTGAAFVLRRRFNTLGRFNLGMAAGAAGLGWLTTFSSFWIIGFGAHSPDEYVFANNLSLMNNIFLVALPAMALMLPFVAFAIVLVTVRAPAYIPPQPQQYGQGLATKPALPFRGAPTWLNGPGNFLTDVDSAGLGGE